METRPSPSGLPTLETLVYVPVGLFATVAAADLLALATGNAALADIAVGLLAAGIVCALIAACCVLAATVAAGHPSVARGSHRSHLTSAALLLALFVASWLLRQLPGDSEAAASALSGVGLAGTVLLLRRMRLTSRHVEAVSA